MNIVLLVAAAAAVLAEADTGEGPGRTGSDSGDDDDDWTRNYWNQWLPESGNEIGPPIDVEKLGERLRRSVRLLKDNNKIELIFLVDASSSIGNANFQSELKFVQKLVADFKVGPSDTRVALIAFASSAQQHVNHLEGSEQHDKCTFLHSELPTIEYTGGNTDTIGALLKAREIFNKSRDGAQKAVFLVTDGFSNKGDPIPTAKELKENGITIFTFGIQTGNVQEVRGMSSTPIEDYSFVLDSFSEFEALARRALHEDLKSGTYVEVNSSAACNRLCSEKDPPLDTGCCNNQSRCSCGILTGHFSCLCPPGFYGTGLIGEECQPCPSGTYHDGSHPGDVLVCIECPDINHITVPPAIGRQDCICKEGYFPVGDSCEVMKCPTPTAPENGYFVKKNCSNVLNAACGVRCGTGYKLHGSSVRICQANGKWSGTPPSCAPKSCNKPKPVRESIITCRNEDYGLETVMRHDKKGNLLESSAKRITNESEVGDAVSPEDFNYTVDTTCTFKCLSGYTMIGSKSRTCLPILRWNGLATSCTVINCPSLSLLKDGFIQPEACTVDGLIHDFATECSITCKQGYRLEGPSLRNCTGRRGTWTGKNIPNKCIDVEPPTFTCPDNITVETSAEESYALVNLSLPQGTDNSGAEPIIWSKPPFLPEYPLPLKIGTTKVEVYGIDASDNGDLCEFYVEVQDNEVPEVFHCESPPTFYLSELNSDSAEVNWTEPIFTDNSQAPLIIDKSHDFGNFSLGTTSVLYTATDASGNAANCTLNITIAENPCADRPNLGNVNWNCSSESSTVLCTVSCPPGLTWTTDNDLTNSTLMCRYDRAGAVWSPDLFSDPEAVPECSVFELPTQVTESHEIELDGRDVQCDDLDNLTSEISNDINILLGTSDVANVSIIADCVADESDNVIASAEEDEEEEESNGIPTRKKRSPQEKRKRVRIRVNLTGSSSNETSAQEVIKRLQDLGQRVEDGYAKNSFVNIGGRKVQVQNARVSNPANLRCNPGYSLKRGLCVQCPQGTFYNPSTSNCTPCPIGTYQSLPGRLQCDSCPSGFLTRRRRRKQLKDCKKICPAGTFGTIKNQRQKVALAPCTPCASGFYQPSSGQASCIECPDGKTTKRKGSTQGGQCIDKMAIDDPCYQFGCKNNGTCFLYNGYPYCTCPEGYLGSFCERPKNHCDSSPCYNNAECVPVDVSGFTCICPDGYGGDLCQFEVNECASDPCANGGDCVDLLSGYKCECAAGFTGENCEVDIDECELYNPCLNNGICNDLVNGYNCTCAGGFTGRHCEEISECEPNDEVDKDCNVKLPETTDPCSGVLCPSNMECVVTSGRNGHPVCACRKGYYGRNCSEEVNFNVILTFPKRSVTEYLAVNLGEDAIPEISVCLWIQTSDQFNYGTLFSYAVKGDDNTFTVTDYKGFVLYVRNQRVVTDVEANDGRWHFICVTWGSNAGRWEIFLDGKSRGKGAGLSADSTIPGGGRFIIGQEQDRFGGGFTEVESFVGRITHFDVWNRILQRSEVEDMNENCKFFQGNLISWVEFLENIYGDIEIHKSTFCTNCNPRELRVFRGYVNIENIGDSTFAVYECEKGFRIAFDGDKKWQESENDTNVWYGKCLKHGNWEEPLPRCTRISCGFPGYFPHGTIIGDSYLYSDSIEYRCGPGYTVVGDSTRLCLENGSWSGDQPTCKGGGGFCEQITAPRHGSMFIYLGEQRKLHSTEIGDKAEFVCDEGYRIQGATTLTCAEGGAWDQDVPTCERISCGFPEEIREYVVNSSDAGDLAFGATLLVKCDELDDLRTIQCQQTGSWNFTAGMCGNKCKLKPRYPEFGLLLGDPLQYLYEAGERVYVKCRYGYKLYGDDFFTCTTNGTWYQRMETRCRPVECVKPIPPPNSYTITTFNNYPYGRRMLFHCLPGYIQSGELLTRCDGEGRWTRIFGRCVNPPS